MLNFLPSWLGGKRKKKGFGKVSRNILAYITPSQIVTLSLVIFCVYLNWDMLLLNFNTNVALNGAIIGLLFYAMGLSIWNNIKLLRTANFLARVDAIIAQDEITSADVEELRYRLTTQGALMDTTYMHDGVDNIGKYGSLNLNDTGARLTKSKLGFRLRIAKGNVGFLSGISVMMGLLGTFFGLLKTIDAVGEALGGMGSMDGGDMGGFIESIAAPLQGMGLAFSSSLFGLSGSLLIGFYSNLCGTAQNGFMENVARWIDDRIPEFDLSKKVDKMVKEGEKVAAEAAKAEGVTPVASPPVVEGAVPVVAPVVATPEPKPVRPNIRKDEMMTLMAGVSYLSNKTNQRLGDLMPLLTAGAESTIELSKLTAKSTHHMIEMSENQSEMSKVLSQTGQMIERMGQGLRTVVQQGEDMSTMFKQTVPAAVTSLRALEVNLVPLTQNVSDMLGQVSETQKAQSETSVVIANKNVELMNAQSVQQQSYQAEMRQGFEKMAEMGEATVSSIATSNATLGQISQDGSTELKNVASQIATLASVVAQMQGNQSHLSAEMTKLCQVLNESHNDVRAFKMAEQLDDVVTRLKEVSANEASVAVNGGKAGSGKKFSFFGRTKK